MHVILIFKIKLHHCALLKLNNCLNKYQNVLNKKYYKHTFENFSSKKSLVLIIYTESGNFNQQKHFIVANLKKTYNLNSFINQMFKMN